MQILQPRNKQNCLKRTKVDVVRIKWYLSQVMDDKKYDVGVMATRDVNMTKTINKASSHVIPVKNPRKNKKECVVVN